MGLKGIGAPAKWDGTPPLTGKQIERSALRGLSKEERRKSKSLAADLMRSALLPSPSAPTLPQLEKKLYRTWTRLNATLCRDDIESRQYDVLNAAADLVRRWEWLKKQGLWP